MSRGDLRHVTQIAIVVRDIEKTVSIWSGLLGLEKPPITQAESQEATHMTFRGKPSKGRARLSFLNLENVVLEFIQPIGGPSTWQDFLERCGEGIHHIAFDVENLEGALDNFRELGVTVEQKGDFKGGCYVYTDPKSELKAIIELLHIHA